MTTTAKEFHDIQAGKIADAYRARGYDVTVEPAEDALPSFLAGYRPDLIARKEDESVVVEVKVGASTSVVERFRGIAEAVKSHPGWRFDLVVVNDAGHGYEVPSALADEREVSARVEQADLLIAKGHIDAAFLLSWSAFEGALRLLASHRSVPIESLPVATMLRELFSAGEISLNSFQSARVLLDIRNRLIHGFSGSVREQEARKMALLVREILAELGRPAPAQSGA